MMAYPLETSKLKKEQMMAFLLYLCSFSHFLLIPSVFFLVKPISQYTKQDRLDSKLQNKVVEIKRRATRVNSFRSINGIILGFPRFKEGLKEIRGLFEQCDEDNNDAIDRDELKKCLQKLQLAISEKEMDDLFFACDIDEKEGIQLNEFIVLLCLIYILSDGSNSYHSTSKILSQELEATFDTVVEAFLFLDKNGKGQLNKKDVVKALNDAFPREKSPSHVTRTRFKEMDWNRKGKVSFREFLFAFIKWVGIDFDDEEIHIESEPES